MIDILTILDPRLHAEAEEGMESKMGMWEILSFGYARKGSIMES